jgi:hypothetical protein
MSKSSDIFGVSKFEVGACGDGVMGTTLVEFNDIAEGTATLNLPKNETIKLFSETNRKTPYRIIEGGVTEGPKLELELLGVDMDKWATFLGGTYASGKWTYPNTSTSIYKSVRLTTKETNDAGTVLQIDMPYALITSGIEGALTFNNLATIKVTIEAMVPWSAAGVEGTALTIEEV